MKTLSIVSIVLIAIVLLSSIISVTTVVTLSTVKDNTSCTLDSGNIYKMVEATAMDKAAKEYAHSHDMEYVDTNSPNAERHIVPEVVYYWYQKTHITSLS